ncbi:MAG: NAD(P)-dependent oxidoreductase [Ferruginibacter sp.]|nr:NAD(P)-dependent oxidoreductase [Ferruginibacter sp.]
MKILVSEASGYIGNKLADIVANTGNDVCGLVGLLPVKNMLYTLIYT